MENSLNCKGRIQHFYSVNEPHTKKIKQQQNGVQWRKTGDRRVASWRLTRVLEQGTLSPV